MTVVVTIVTDHVRTKRDRVSRTAMDDVRVAHARARLVMNALSAQFAAYYQSRGELKSLADSGFPHGDPKWKAAQSKLGADLDSLIRRAVKELEFRVS